MSEFKVTKAPLLERFQSAINCAESMEPGFISPVMREVRDELKKARREVRELKAKLKYEQSRAHWNGKT